MVEITVTATVERAEEHRDRRDSHGPEFFASAMLTETREVTATVEFPNGYANLEAYAPDVQSFNPPVEVAQSVLSYADVPDEWDVVADEPVDVTVSGTGEEWKRAAGAWAAERPSYTPRDMLELFADSGHTNLRADQIDAILEAADAA